MNPLFQHTCLLRVAPRRGSSACGSVQTLNNVNNSCPERALPCNVGVRRCTAYPTTIAQSARCHAVWECAASNAGTCTNNFARAAMHISCASTYVQYVCLHVRLKRTHYFLRCIALRSPRSRMRRGSPVGGAHLGYTCNCLCEGVGCRCAVQRVRHK
jgi:hypothetical protein